MGTNTTNLNLYKPAQSETGWADEVNANFDTLDTRIFSPHPAIMYVASWGSDANDGRTWATAKKRVNAAFDALPADGGTIYVSSGTATETSWIVSWDDDPTRGLWLVGPNDPRYASVPTNGPDAAGFRRTKRIRLIGRAARPYGDGMLEHVTYIAGGSGTDPSKPAIWLSGSGQHLFDGIRCVGLAQTVKLGIDTTDGVTHVNTALSTFRNCVFTTRADVSSAVATGRQATILCGYMFWLWIERCLISSAPIIMPTNSVALDSGTVYTFTTTIDHGISVGEVVLHSGYTPSGYNGIFDVLEVPSSTTYKVNIGSNPGAVSVQGNSRWLLSPRRAAIFCKNDPGNANSGLIQIRDTVFGGGGIRYQPAGSGSWGNIHVYDSLMEGDFVNEQPPLFHFASNSGPERTPGTYVSTTSSGQFYFRGVSIADGLSTLGGIRTVEGTLDPGVTVVESSQIKVVGPATVIGGGTHNSVALNDGYKLGTLGHSLDRRLYGQLSSERWKLGMSGGPYVNLADQDVNNWSAKTGGATVTTGKIAPDGTATAAEITVPGSTPQDKQVYRATRTLAIGDWFLFGAWLRQVNGQQGSADHPITVTFAGGSGTWRLETPTASGKAGVQYRVDDRDWRCSMYAAKVVAGSSTSPEVILSVLASEVGYPNQFWRPFLIHIPAADGWSDAQVREMSNGMDPYSNLLSVGEVGPHTSQVLNALGGLKIGDGGAVTKMLTGSATWDPGSIADGDDASTTVTVTGAAVGDPCFSGFSSMTTQDVFIDAHVQATNTVRVKLLNRSGSSQDFASGTVKVTVFQNA